MSGHWSGYTENYIRVTVVSDDRLTNRVLPVQLDEACGDFVMGTLNVNEPVKA